MVPPGDRAPHPGEHNHADMGSYRATGIILRLQKLGEADRIVTLLTLQHGKIRVSARGVRRTRSRFGARLEPFSHVDLQLYTGRTLDTITQVQPIDVFGQHIVTDYDRYTAGCALLETADRLTTEHEPARELFVLTVAALRGLGGQRDPSLILDAYLLRAMVITGWAPAIDACALCGAPGPLEHYSMASGGAVCPRCRPAGCARPQAGTWALLVALRDGDWPTAEAAEHRARREAAGLIAAHLSWHLDDRGLRSLALINRSIVPA